MATCVAWVGVIASSAASASAVAWTKQSGDYAACSNNYGTESHSFCNWDTSYVQTIRFMGTPCNSGGNCGEDLTGVYLDFIVDTGRKPAFLTDCLLYTSPSPRDS